MSVVLYMKKEHALAVLTEALNAYHMAAEHYYDNQDAMCRELDDMFADSDLAHLEVRKHPDV